MREKDWDARGHLTSAALDALKNGETRGGELDAQLAHLGNCAACAQRFAAGIAPEELAPLPKGFAECVRARLPQKRAPLLGYSLRVAVAACLALLFLFSGALRGMADSSQTPSPRAPDLGFVSDFTAGMRTFSQSVLIRISH